MRYKAAVYLILFTLSLMLGCTKSGYKPVPQYTIEQFMDKVSITGASLSYDETKLLLATDKSGDGGASPVVGTFGNGAFLTAIATDPAGNTSEFSMCF